MALTNKQKKDFNRQLEAAKNQLKQLSATLAKRQSAEYGSRGTGSRVPNDFGGARGSEFSENVSQQAKDESSAYSVPEDLSRDDTFLNYSRGGGYSVPKLSSGEAVGLAKEYGLEKIGNPNDFVGLTRAQAQKKAQDKRNELMGQQSALTSYAFNPKTISGFNKKLDELRLTLDNRNDEAWTNPRQKKEQNKALIDSYNDQFAKMFSSPEEYQAAMQNPEFQKSLQQYQAIGGDPNAIASRVTQPSVEGEVISPYQQEGIQDLDTFLGNLTAESDQKALETLIPEKEIYQAQIAQQYNIVNQYKDAYFGTEEQVGFIEQQKQQAQEEIKLIERQAKVEERNMRAQAEFAIQRNNKEMELEAAQIEENRLAAKNYMTGMLAKLGALKTTGKAPEALATLEQKYQKQSMELKSNYRFENQAIELKLNKAVDEVELARDEAVLQTKSDLSKDEETVWKEIFKMQNDADSKALSIIQTYAQEFRSQREKYVKEAKAEAEKCAKQMEKIASVYDVSGVSSKIKEGEYTVTGSGKNRQEGIVSPDGSIIPFDLTPTMGQEVKNAGVAGVDGVKFFTSTEPAFRDYVVRNSVYVGSLSALKKEYDKWVKDVKNIDDEEFGWAIEEEV